MELIHDDARIYGLDENGRLIAEITFPRIASGTVDITRTFVDSSLQGQGVADRLVRAAAEDLRSRGLKAVVTCPYAAKWFSKHPEFSDLLDG